MTYKGRPTAYIPPGKVPGFPAKTVHFPPWLVGVSALQASLAAPVVSTLGKVPGIPAKTVHFPPCGVLMKIQQSKRPGPPTASRRAPPGKVPGIPAKAVHFSPRPYVPPALQPSLAALAISSPWESAAISCENGSLSPVVGWGTGSTGISGGT